MSLIGRVSAMATLIVVAVLGTGPGHWGHVSRHIVPLGSVSGRALPSPSRSSQTVPSHAVRSAPCPPRGFDPLKASPAQLQKYGFPPRPPSGEGLRGWTQAMKHAKHCVAPQFTTRSGTTGGPEHG